MHNQSGRNGRLSLGACFPWSHLASEVRFGEERKRNNVGFLRASQRVLQVSCIDFLRKIWQRLLQYLSGFQVSILGRCAIQTGETLMVRMSANQAPDSAPIPQSGEIDAKRLAVAEQRRRRKRAKDRDQPRPELLDWGPAAERRAKARPYPPGIMLAPAGFDKEHWTAPHSDPDLWTLQLADAFGTRSLAVISTFMDQLERLCARTVWDEEARQWRLDENQFSTAIAMVNTIKPKNEMEAAIAAQMVAVHFLQMKVSARALESSYDPQMSAAASKLARTFTMQLDALRALKGRKQTTRQSIKVTKELHQHVHYHDDRGGRQNATQPHERRAAIADQCEALPSAQSVGTVVPLPSRQRP